MEKEQEIKNMTKRRMKINIKGKFKKFWAHVFLRNTMKSMGVDIYEITSPDANQVEMVLSGYKPHLWNVIKWTKNQSIFFVLTEVAFEFVE
jgi:hypothetical protein